MRYHPKQSTAPHPWPKPNHPRTELLDSVQEVFAPLPDPSAISCSQEDEDKPKQIAEIAQRNNDNDKKEIAPSDESQNTFNKSKNIQKKANLVNNPSRTEPDVKKDERPSMRTKVISPTQWNAWVQMQQKNR